MPDSDFDATIADARQHNILVSASTPCPQISVDTVMTAPVSEAVAVLSSQVLDGHGKLSQAICLFVFGNFTSQARELVRSEQLNSMKILLSRRMW
jgi:hypothetical protein